MSNNKTTVVVVDDAVPGSPVVATVEREDPLVSGHSGSVSTGSTIEVGLDQRGAN